MTKTPISVSLTIALALMAIMSSCKSPSLVVRADDYDAETIVDLMNEEEPVINPAKGHKEVTPPSRKHVIESSPIDGEWVIVAAHGKNISRDDDMPYLIFQSSEGKFYASNGCNVFNGKFDYSNQTVTFADVVSTLKRCPDSNYAKVINSVLVDGSTVKVKIEDKNRESYLYLYSPANTLLLTLRRHNLEVINGLWQVVDIEGEATDDDEINLFFDIPERSVHGNTGCNYFNGTITMDPNAASSISFSQMGVTMRYCDKADIERKFLVALEETDVYELKDHNTLYFISSRGKKLMTLRRINQD